MDAAQLNEIFRLVMQNPRMLIGAAEVACVAYAPSREMVIERLIAGTIPFGHGWKTDPPFGPTPFWTHLHFKNTFLYIFLGCSGGYPIGCSNGTRRERNRVHSLRGRLDGATTTSAAALAQLDVAHEVNRSQAVKLQRLQDCIDEAHHHLERREQLGAQEVLEIEISDGVCV